MLRRRGPNLPSARNGTYPVHMVMSNAAVTRRQQQEQHTTADPPLPSTRMCVPPNRTKIATQHTHQVYFRTPKTTNMPNPSFSNHTALSDEVLAEFRKLPQNGKIMAEYIWIGGSGQDLRCKTRTFDRKPKTAADL